MKRILATLLTLVILLSVAPSVGTVAAAEATPDKPFIAMAWNKAEIEKYGNVVNAPVIKINNIGGRIRFSYDDLSEPAEIAKSMKPVLDKLPEGMRHIRLFLTREALKLDADLVIYADKGIVQLHDLFVEFIEAYYALGGKLDGVILDTEYVKMESLYLYREQYGNANNPTNPNFYNDLVAHPRYATEVRPMLEEYGFKFYEDVGGNKSEIWSMLPKQFLAAEERIKYEGCYEIWNQVMYDRQAMYFNYALFEPMVARYPDAVMSDYQAFDNKSWHQNSHSYSNNYSNGIKVGNVSNYNDYLREPSESYFVDSSGNYLYKNPKSYNGASYDDDPYGMLLWHVNLFKNIYEATDTKKISVWIAEYDYGSREGAYRNSPYYTEALYHYGMLDPQPFLVFMPKSEDKFKGDAGQVAYDERMQVISEVLNELTRVAGYSDRKPISVPANWNDGYLLSGLYAGGRNIWRITPDTTDGTTLTSFKREDKDPTFSINGTTITFPGGSIIADGAVSVVGSTGYWVETSKDVTPVVTRDANRYAENPSYMEDYESYATGTALNSANVALPQTWNIRSDKQLLITEDKALALTGTASLENVKLPANITAGDSYAKQQAWEISVTLPEAMNSGARVVLLNTTLNGGIKLEDGKVYYDENGSYKELAGVDLIAGQKYTFKRDMNFTDSTCTYSVYAGGKLLKEAANVKIESIDTPVKTIYISCSGLTTQVLIDDYKLYPTGLVHALTVYDANGGEKLASDEKNAKSQVAYRLSWMNATALSTNVKVKAAHYDSNDKLISETVVATVNMAAGDDGVLTGIVQNQGAKVMVYLEGARETPDTTEPTKKPTEPSVKPTQKPTASATQAIEPSVAPTKAPTQALTNGSSKAPTKMTIGRPTKGTVPGETLVPEETLAPGETLAPEETLAPGETLAPEETLAPGETLAPEETQAPVATETPDTTEAPDATEATNATEAPDATTAVAPDKDEDKDGANVGVVIVIVVVVLAVAGGAAWFFLKKKKVQ